MEKLNTDVRVRKFSGTWWGCGITAESEAGTVTQEQTAGNDWDLKSSTEWLDHKG